MDYRLECEARLADHYRKAADVDSEEWKKPVRIPRYRVTVAKTLVALAARIAPTVSLPSPIIRARAQ